MDQLCLVLGRKVTHPVILAQTLLVEFPNATVLGKDQDTFEQRITNPGVLPSHFPGKRSFGSWRPVSIRSAQFRYGPQIRPDMGPAHHCLIAENLAGIRTFYGRLTKRIADARGTRLRV